MSKKARIIGVNMVKFAKPGVHEPYEVMGAKAIQGALDDAGIGYQEVQQAFAGYVYGDSTCGQRVAYGVGMSGIPVFNLNNYCASGSSALFLARQAVESGVIDCALAFGFEEMKPGALASAFGDRTSPVGWIYERQRELAPELPEDAPRAIKAFGSAGYEYVNRYGANPDIFAKVAVKTRSHAVNNPYSLFTKPLTIDDVMGATLLYPHLTRLMACPPTCGAAAAIVCSEEFAARHGITNAIEIAAQAIDHRQRGQQAEPHQPGGRRHDAPRRAPGLRCSGHRPRGRGRGGTARLLHAERGHQLRRPGALPGGWRREVHQ
jgi:acetyl-CoA acetyltransferase